MRHSTRLGNSLTGYMTTQPHHVYLRPEDVPYQHLQPIGHGGQASVDSVQREGRVYARKLFMLSWTPKPRELERVLEEVRIANGLVHQHVVRLIETYQQRNLYAIIMEPVAEGNLATYMSDLDGISLEQGAERREHLAEWFQCLVTALCYLHDSGVRHRDMKPHSIITLKGRVYFTDFGISETFQEPTISGTTDIIGTRTYLPLTGAGVLQEVRAKRRYILPRRCVSRALDGLHSTKSTQRMARV